MCEIVGTFPAKEKGVGMGNISESHDMSNFHSKNIYHDIVQDTISWDTSDSPHCLLSLKT